MPKVISTEQAAEENERAIRERAEGRIDGLVKALTAEDVDFDVERNDEDGEQQLYDYRKSAHSGLKAIMAAAGVEEEKAARKKFGRSARNPA